VNPLRSKSRLTKTLLLMEVVSERHSTLKTIAGNLDITSQAVSDYFHQMKKEGYMANEDGFYTATNEGVLFLQNNLLDIKSFVDERLSTLSIIRSTNAIAENRIRKGERVYLFMKQGLLFATSGSKTTSSGVAATDCPKDGVLVVEQLEGIVEMDPGKLSLISLPEKTGGIGKRDLQKHLDTHCRVAALDLDAVALLREKKIDCHYEFATLPVLRDSLQRGISITCLGRQKNIHDLEEDITEHNKRSNYKIETKSKRI